MTKQPEDWLDDVPGDDIEDEDDEIIWVSKSEIKRDAEELKHLGVELVKLGKNALDKIPLDADLRAAIELAQRIKMEGRRRQLQLIGKMLRQRDVDPIRQALDKLKNRHNQQVVVFHKLEQLRDRMVDGSDEAIEEVMNLWPDADRQQLRSLVRNARKEKAGNKPPKSSRQIFQYLRELAEKRGLTSSSAESAGWRCKHLIRPTIRCRPGKRSATGHFFTLLLPELSSPDHPAVFDGCRQTRRCSSPECDRQAVRFSPPYLPVHPHRHSSAQAERRLPRLLLPATECAGVAAGTLRLHALTTAPGHLCTGPFSWCSSEVPAPR